MSARTMWTAVVLQAVNDIDTEPYGSIDYDQAVSFFRAPGEWAESRQNVADCLELHADDLVRLGKAAIDARHRRDGPEPVVLRLAATPQPTRPEPSPQCIAAPVVTSLPQLPSEREQRRRVRQAALAEKRDRQWWIRRFLAREAA